ncbi:hypothetical protein AAFF_G00000160 [Aldrovandia affinis]|uniref:Claudin n=1 Tax=Aldrovandia affinis TaxID=143900 RepID=A0AAD7TCN5_9TELE|nr:hypothetical protein AAFF_G00000160 [Aldrovandia affinis]
MAVTMCQVMGFILSLLGVGGIIASTVMDQWSTEDLYSNPVTAIYTYYGLWRSCVRQSTGFTECRPYFTILGLPGIVIGAIGILIAIFAMKCIRIGSMDDTAKANMTLTSGIMFVLAGVLSIAGVSVFANLIVTTFQMTTYASSPFLGMSGLGSGGLGGTLTPRYTFGDALFIGWVGGAVLLVGGIMMCLACKGMIPEKPRQLFNTGGYKAPSHNTIYRSEDRNRQAYDESFKARSEDGRRSNQKYDYV